MGYGHAFSVTTLAIAGDVAGEGEVLGNLRAHDRDLALAGIDAVVEHDHEHVQPDLLGWVSDHGQDVTGELYHDVFEHA
jgi:hypothetical protein